jgi:hypothetical protein
MSAADSRPWTAPRTAPMGADRNAEDQLAWAAVAAARRSPDAPPKDCRGWADTTRRWVRSPSHNRPGRPLAAPPMRTPDEHRSLAGGCPRWMAAAHPMSTGDRCPPVSAQDGTVPPLMSGWDRRRTRHRHPSAPRRIRGRAVRGSACRARARGGSDHRRNRS